MSPPASTFVCRGKSGSNAPIAGACFPEHPAPARMLLVAIYGVAAITAWSGTSEDTVESVDAAA